MEKQELEKMKLSGMPEWMIILKEAYEREMKKQGAKNENN